MSQPHLTLRLLGALALASLLAAGCTEDPVSPARSVTVSAPSLPPIAGDAYYELWFSYPSSGTQGKNPRPDHSDGAYFSVGKFRIDAEGAMVSLSGAPATFAIPEGYNANLIIDALLTVESTNDTDTLPGARMLAAPFRGTTEQALARLQPDDGEAFGSKIRRDSSGQVSLDAPTSNLPADAIRGIWFVRFVTDPFSAIIDTLPGLTLAPMPLNADNPNWSYQGWLVRNEGTSSEEYIKLGRFMDPAGIDSTGAGSGAGMVPKRVHEAPGEDFVGGTPKRVLNDGTYGVIVSAEPTGIELERPLVTVLKLDRIPAGHTTQTAMTLLRPANQIYMEVTVDR